MSYVVTNAWPCCGVAHTDESQSCDEAITHHVADVDGDGENYEHIEQAHQRNMNDESGDDVVSAHFAVHEDLMNVATAALEA